MENSLSPVPSFKGNYAALFGPVNLSGCAPLASGGDRHVFQHPFETSLLIKVVDLKARAVYLKTRPFKRWYQRFYRQNDYQLYMKEMTEYVAAITLPEIAWKVPMARIAGIAQTSLGPGLLVEKISNEQGNMAQTVADIVRMRGLNPALRHELDTFFAHLAELHVLVHEVSLTNIAYGLNADGVPGMYLIDGFGVTPFIPLYAWSKTLNRWRIQRKYRRMLERLERP